MIELGIKTNSMIEKIKNHLLNGVLLLVLFSSCKKDVSLEFQQENQANFNELKSLVIQVKLWHDSTVSSNLNTKFQNGIRAFSVNENDITPPTVDWEKAFINYDSSSVKSITIPIFMNYKDGEHMELVATKFKNKINGYYINVIPDSSYFAKQNDLFNYSDFSGSISIYNLNGIRLKKEIFKQGIVSNSVTNNKVSQSNRTFMESEPPCEGCNLLTVVVYNTKRFSYSFGSYDYGLIYISNYQNIQVDGTDGGGGGGGVFAGGDESPDGYVDEIITKITDPCISSVMDDIFSNDKQSEMMSYIKRQFGLNEKYNLNITDVENLKNSKGIFVAGLARPNRDNGILTVYISINYGKNSSKEFYAATILHEMIHGYIESQNIAQNGKEKEEVIANSKYVGWMSAALISLFPNLSLSDANALALGGLQGTSYFKSLSINIQDASNTTNARHELGNEGQKCN
jgi:hypothetical protein